MKMMESGAVTQIRGPVVDSRSALMLPLICVEVKFNSNTDLSNFL